MNWDWGVWTPQENVILSIRELLQEALIPDTEVQRKVRQKLGWIQNIGDYTYYLLFIISNPNYPGEIRSLSGILLKNTINSQPELFSADYLFWIRLECMRLLQDPCKDVRISMSNVIVTLAKHSLGNWPELIPFLISAFDVSYEMSEIALNTLFKICEELIRNKKSNEEIYGVISRVFPKLNDMLTQRKCIFHHDIIRLVNQFLQDYFFVVKQSVDLGIYLRNIMLYAESEEVEVQKQVSLTLVLYLSNREDSLIPHLHNIIIYLLAKTQHKDRKVALQACEFWITATKLDNCKEILTPYMDELIPVLLKNMRYSEYELTTLRDCLGSDYYDQFRARAYYRDRYAAEGENYTDDDEDDSFNGDYDDSHIGWTLRKCSAASLDGIAVRFRDDLLPYLLPYINGMLPHLDYIVRESAVLAVGAIAEGCNAGLRPHMPYLVDYLVKSMRDEHSLIRVITCWTLGRYISWIINEDDAHFIPVIIALLDHFVDNNKRVQCAAISAFCILQEKAKLKLVPYIALILDGFEQVFERYRYKCSYLLYDAISALAQSVGNQLSKREYVNKLMPRLMEKLSHFDNYCDDNFVTILECLPNLILAFDVLFTPYCEAVYWYCLNIISETVHLTVNHKSNPNEYDEPNKEPMKVAIDILHSISLALKSQFFKYVANSNLLCLLHTAMLDPTAYIRQTSIALYGELINPNFPYLFSTYPEYIMILINNIDEKWDGVCNNAAWAIGKLASVIGANIKPYVVDIFTPLVTLLFNPQMNRTMFQTVAISFFIVCYVTDEVRLVPELERVLKNGCMLMKNVKDSIDKDLAFRGLCKAVIYCPDFFKNNFMYFCDAVASWNNIRYDLKEIIKTIIEMFREESSMENWNASFQKFPEALKTRLVNLYGV